VEQVLPRMGVGAQAMFTLTCKGKNDKIKREKKKNKTEASS
jgi:hypothetical protein